MEVVITERIKELKELVKVLTELHGNVGHEDEVIKYICHSLKDRADEVKIDAIGNVTALFKCGKENAKKVMLFGHMDEVGMVVRKIEQNGFLRAEKLGSINPNIIPGSSVEVIGKKGKIPGVVGSKSHHLLQPDDKYKIAGFDKLYIDIGANSMDDVKSMGIEVGTPIVMKSRFSELANNLVTNKAMDDRASLAVMIYLSENIKREELDCDLYLVFSVQEEFNTRGIMPVVREIIPDIAIGIDVTPSCDTPDLKGYSDISLGKGIAITFMNHHGRGTLAGLVPNMKFVNFLQEICIKNNIKYQNEVTLGVLTETAYILFENSKTIVINLSIPTRYTHTPVEVVSLEDLLSCYDLLYNFLKTYKSSLEFGKYILEKEV
ncbi:M42 family metallopeptidase [Thermoanaerobacterium thermosaccharolyticum]|uniref:M42 family metallopeptidase n=1 Tax=Thermoanaerobacterium thermosaccharolyticum TaxID=1517 RepID=UPI003D2775B4